MLRKIIAIRNIGRWVKLTLTCTQQFSSCTLIYGDNGYGKSTLTDILRSLSLNQPGIITGRKNVRSNEKPSVELLFEPDRAVTFDGGTWSTTIPDIAIFDETYIHENIYSGLEVQVGHLKRQHEIIMGRTGVQIQQAISTAQGAEGVKKTELKDIESRLQQAMRELGLPRTMPIADFRNLQPLPDAAAEIATAERTLHQAEQAHRIQNEPLPCTLPLPPPAENFTTILAADIEHVSEDARQRIHEHISAHALSTSTPTIPHEEWLRAGLDFANDKSCPFCGQAMRERTLIDLYSQYFSQSLKQYLAGIAKSHHTLKRYSEGEYRTTTMATKTANDAHISTLTTLTGHTLNETLDLTQLLTKLQSTATQIDTLLSTKQRDPTTTIDPSSYANTFAEWTDAITQLERYNECIGTFCNAVAATRDMLSEMSVDEIRQTVITLKARVKRHESSMDSLLSQHTACEQKINSLRKTVKQLREQLQAHNAQVAKTLNRSINTILKSIRAGFRIEYSDVRFNTATPAATFHIVIHDEKIPSRVTSANAHDVPHFRNTLSAGDKSLLAFAFFLATLEHQHDLSETIVVFDDPVSSLDEFRSRYTVNRVVDLIKPAKQVILLSHRVEFLALIQATARDHDVTAFRLRAGTSDETIMDCWNIERHSLPRNHQDRLKVRDYIENETGDVLDVIRCVRILAEEFLLPVAPAGPCNGSSLGQKLVALHKRPDSCWYKSQLEDLDYLNKYTRKYHHASDSPAGDELPNPVELRQACELVMELGKERSTDSV